MSSTTLGAGADFTGEQRAVKTLRLSDARYRRLFETAPDGILMLDADAGRVVDANPSRKRPVLG